MGFKRLALMPDPLTRYIIHLILDRSNIQSRFDFVDDGETTDTDRSETTIKELHIDSSDDDSQSTQVQMKL